MKTQSCIIIFYYHRRNENARIKLSTRWYVPPFCLFIISGGLRMSETSKYTVPVELCNNIVEATRFRFNYVSHIILQCHRYMCIWTFVDG